MFEIGVVYKKNNRFFLAVTDRILVSFREGQPMEVRPHHRYDLVRSISVEKLCAHWGVTLDDLDRVTAAYLAPAPEVVKTRPRGSRRRRAADELAWREFRTMRLSLAS